MKILYLFILFLFFVSCIPKEKKHSRNNELIETGTTENNIIGDNINEIPLLNNYTNELIDIEFNVIELNLAHFNNDDMKQNIDIIYYSESDVIKNINEIEPNQKVIEILDKPFEKLEFSILPNYKAPRLFYGIDELLNIFKINIPQNIIEEFNNSGSFEHSRIRVDNLNIYVYKEFNVFKLFYIEYDNDLFYEPRLKTEYSKNDILNLIGNPSAYSDNRNIFIYYELRTLRQINIIFDNNEKVKLVQLISWIDP
jgi:hypothetical protein